MSKSKKQYRSKAVKPQGPKQGHVPQDSQPADLHVVQQTYSGPLPPPAVLQHYNEVIPGAAERILVMAEQNASHRRDLELAALDAHRSEVRLGQWLGFGIGLASLAAAIIALVLGHPATAGVIGGTTVVGLVAVFVTGRMAEE